MATATVTPTTQPEEQVTPAPSEREVIFAATNEPTLSPDEFKLGPKTFKVMNLRYDDYIQFLGYLRPFLEGIGQALVASKGIQVPSISIEGPSLNIDALFNFCLRDLPDMARIVCSQTDESVTVEQVKEWAGEPFTLCEIVLRQVARNNMIGQFASFFGQLLPILMRMGLMATKESTTKATPSS